MSTPASPIKPTSYYRHPDGRSIVTYSDGAQLVMDSGQVSAFRPADYGKQSAIPVTRRVQGFWNRILGKPDPSRTTERGASSAASPVTFYLSLWAQRFGRRAVIEDCRSLFLADPRIHRSVLYFAREACRGGCTIEVSGKGRYAERARKIAEQYQKLIKPRTLKEWARGVLLEGDLFIQIVLDRFEKEVVGLAAMPSVGMERLTNDADQFVDVERAYAQIDSMTFETVAEFAEWQICHSRWNRVNGDRYGSPDIIAIRRAQRVLELLEQSQQIRRQVRAPLRLLHNIGTTDRPASKQEVLDYKNQNGYVEGKQEVWNPDQAAKDFFGNGTVTVDPVTGDVNIDKIEDLEYMQNVAQAGYPTPGVFFGVGAKQINRDVVEDMRELWLKMTVEVNECLDEPVSQGFELALLLKGIPVDLIDYRVRWSTSTLEKAGEIADWVNTLVDGGLASRRTGVERVKELTGVTDTEAELALIKADLKERTEHEVTKRAAGVTNREKLEDEDAPGRRTNGKATNGKPKPEPVSAN